MEAFDAGATALLQQSVRLSADLTISVVLTPGGDDRLLFDDGLLTGAPFDDTGLVRVWPASIALCRVLQERPGVIANRRVLELGAGTGLPSLLCARHLGAARVLATDGNMAAVAKLSDALSDCRHAHALQLTWDAPDALVALVASERIDTLLLADCVYPSKDATPLLEALGSVLILGATPALCIYCACTCREPATHRQFDAALRALPAHCESVATFEREEDPLYGEATVHVYRLTAHVASCAGSAGSAWAVDGAASVSTWRLAAARLRLWPESPPARVRPYHHGWVHVGNERMLRMLLRKLRPRVIIELGSWLGLCTTLLLEETAAEDDQVRESPQESAEGPRHADLACRSADGSSGISGVGVGGRGRVGACVFAIDRWDPGFLLATQLEQYVDDEEALAILRGGSLQGVDEAPLPLYETFLANMWPWRHRLFPLRMDTSTGLQAVAEMRAPVDLIYIDADHTHDGALADLRCAARCFPKALIAGDDWQWAGVRGAVTQHVAESDGRLRVHAHPKENWWWLEETASHMQLKSRVSNSMAQ